MAFMAVEVCIWHLWLLSSMYVIDGCGGLYMAFMSGGLYVAFMAAEFSICH